MSRCMTSGMMSSASDDWETPLDLWEKLNEEFGFDLDVCASSDNAKCAAYFDIEADGLKQPWTGTVCMNPPYGRRIGEWMKKAMQHGRGGIAVCLVPARTDTIWWREYCMKASEIRLIKGRLKFGRSKNSAPFPSAIIIFGTPVAPRFSMMEVVG